MGSSGKPAPPRFLRQQRYYLVVLALNPPQMMVETTLVDEDDERSQSEDWLSKIPIFGRKPKRSGKRGRPQVRSDRDVQLTLRIPAQDYANLVGYIEMLRERARSEGMTEGRFSRQAILMGLWKNHWAELDYAQKRLAQSNKPYREALKRAEDGGHSTDL